MPRTSRAVLGCALITLSVIGCGEDVPIRRDAAPPSDDCDVDAAAGLRPGQTAFVNVWLNPVVRDPLSPDGGAEPQVDHLGYWEQEAGRLLDRSASSLQHVIGNHLVDLGQGLSMAVYDVTDPKQPLRVARLDFDGSAVAAFVEGTTVLALVRQVVTIKSSRDTLDLRRREASKLMSIDVSDPRQPRVLRELHIDGSIHDLAWRKVGNTIHVASLSWDSASGWRTPYDSRSARLRAWVQSFDVTSPAAPRPLQRLQVLDLAPNERESDGRESSFPNVAIATAPDAFLFVEQWRPSHSSCPQGARSVVSIVDAGGEEGKLRFHTRFETAGRLTGAFHQTLLTESSRSPRRTYLGMFARASSQDGCEDPRRLNALESWDVSDGAAPRRIARLDVGAPSDRLSGLEWDLERRRAYAFLDHGVERRVHAFSFEAPAAPALLSQMKEPSADLAQMALVDAGRFLLTIDQPSGQCAGASLTLLDVRDAAQIRRTQQVCARVGDTPDPPANPRRWLRSAGLQSEGGRSLVSLLTAFAVAGAFDATARSELASIELDFSRFIEGKPPGEQTVLVPGGFITYPGTTDMIGAPMVFASSDGGRTVLTELGWSHLGLSDWRDLATPTPLATFDRTTATQTVHRFGDYLVESDGTEVRTRRFGGPLDDRPVLATTKVAPLVSHGNLLVGRRADAAVGGDVDVLVYDFTNPVAPTLASTGSRVGWPRYGASWTFDQTRAGGGAFSSGGGIRPAATSSAVVLRAFTEGAPDAAGNVSVVASHLEVLDVAVPTAPKVIRLPDDVSSLGTGGPLVSDGADRDGVFFNREQSLGYVERDGVLFYTHRWWAERWAPGASGWQAEVPINVPGMLIDTWRDATGARLFVTHQIQSTVTGSVESAPGRSIMRKHSLALSREVRLPSGARAAALVAVHELAGMLGGYVREGARLYVTVGSTPATATHLHEEQNRLTILDADAGGLALRYDQPIGTYGAQVVAAVAGRLALLVRSEGVIVLDARQPTAPKAHGFVNTRGYLRGTLELSGNDLYVAAGSLGTLHLDLAAVPNILPE